MNEIVLAIGTSMQHGVDSNNKPYKGISKRKAVKEITEVAKLVGSMKSTHIFTCRLVAKDTVVARINKDFTHLLPELTADSIQHLCEWKHIQISFMIQNGVSMLDGEKLL